ncbi:aldehyde dehydrogenase family protein [Ferviditalea candida]|uniref:aldehyde dehydrogenase family protein n=1 Tax=Ferviditalea candida TaxID=3108399 RepID=UPI00352C92BE
MKINLFINNEQVETEQYTEVRDPGRLDEVAGLAAKGTPQHVDAAVKAAHQAFLCWRKTAVDERIDLIRKAANRLEAGIPGLTPIVSKENGMLLRFTKGEIHAAVTVMRHLADLAAASLQSKRYEDETGWVSVEKVPIGVVAGIVPWNAPIVLTMQKLAPALLSGNSIVFKPSPFAPIGVSTAIQMIADLFPPGVVQVVLGDADVGSALNKHPLVRKISFTGGGATAKYVMKDAADSLKSVHFELGGNDPAIILDDADLDKMVPQIVWGAFRRSGQFCFATKRVYVPERMYEDVYERVVSIVDQFKIGHQLNEETTFGPLINRSQYEYIKQLTERVKQSSAKMVELGTKLQPEQWENGYYLSPVVVRDLQPNDEIVTVEQFGPIMPLISYRSEDEMLKMANDTEYGLGSSIWSTDVDRALCIARRIEAGMTFINGIGQSALGQRYLPFGGVKQSGIGRENSELVFDEYVEYHAINYHKPQ